MKNVIVPAPITFVDRKGKPTSDEPPSTMHDFLMDNILIQGTIGAGLDGARRVRKLDRLFKDTKPGDIVRSLKVLGAIKT